MYRRSVWLVRILSFALIGVAVSPFAFGPVAFGEAVIAERVGKSVEIPVRDGNEWLATAAEAGEARALFDRALAEIRSEVPSKRDAVMRLARDIANGILSGMVAPGEGAKQIWDLSLRVPDEHLPELDSFVYAASEWEDCPVFEDGVIAAARELVGMRQG